MQIFGVGPLELLLILVLALVIMGPQDMVGTARRMGRWIYRVVRSPTWRAIMETTQEFRDLPQKIVRDAGLDEAMKEIQDTATQVKSEMEATSREINTEMQAATSEINQEMSIAAQEVNADPLQASTEPGLPLAAGVTPFSGASPFAGENPERTPGEEDESPIEDGPSDEIGISEAAGPDQTLDDLNPEAILWPELAPEPAPVTPAVPVDTAPDPYVANLETFAVALGGTMKSPSGLEQAPKRKAASRKTRRPAAEKVEQAALPPAPQTITPEMIASMNAAIEPAHPEEPELSSGAETAAPEGETAHPWAPGMSLEPSAQEQASEQVIQGQALSGPAEADMMARFQAQMAAMEKSFEELDAKIQLSRDEAGTGDEPPKPPSNGADAAGSPTPGDEAAEEVASGESETPEKAPEPGDEPAIEAETPAAGPHPDDAHEAVSESDVAGEEQSAAPDPEPPQVDMPPDEPGEAGETVESSSEEEKAG